MNLTIVDNFLEEQEFKKIQDLLLGSWFPWFFNNGIVSLDEKNFNLQNRADLFDFQFTHTFVREGKIVSDSFIHIARIIEKLNPKQVLRIKSNLITPTLEHIQTRFHTDVEDTTGVKTGIFYLNTNNGFTIFEDGTRIPSIENRFILFDADTLHAGTSCTNQKSRCLINFNFIEK
jgi:hypothetical protein